MPWLDLLPDPPVDDVVTSPDLLLISIGVIIVIGVVVAIVMLLRRKK